MHIDSDTLTGANGGRSELADGAPLAPVTARRLACDAGLVALLERDGQPLSVGRKTRTRVLARWFSGRARTSARRR